MYFPNKNSNVSNGMTLKISFSTLYETTITITNVTGPSKIETLATRTAVSLSGRIRSASEKLLFSLQKLPSVCVLLPARILMLIPKNQSLSVELANLTQFESGRCGEVLPH